MSKEKYHLGHTHGSLGMTPNQRDPHYEQGYEDATMKRAYQETKNTPGSRVSNQLNRTAQALSHLGAGKQYGEK